MSLFMTGLCGMAQATMVTYSITGATGDNWTGQFDVQSLAVPASDWMLKNVLSMSANGWDPIVCSSAPGYMFYYGSNSEGWLTWCLYVPAGGGGPYGLTLNSAALGATIKANGWGTTWNDLNGKSYAIDTGEGKQTVFLDPTMGSLTGTGGQISFSMSAIPEVTSSFTLLGLISSGLMLRRRTKILS